MSDKEAQQTNPSSYLSLPPPYELPPAYTIINNLTDNVITVTNPFILSVLDGINKKFNIKYECKCTNNVFGLCTSIFMLLAKFLVVLLAIGFEFGLSIFCIVWGVQYLNYECEKILQIWLIVYGSVCIANKLYVYMKSFYKKKKSSNDKGNEDFITAIFGLFVLAWIIVGSVWVYELFQSESYICPINIVNLTFSIVTIVWGLFALVIAVILLVSSFYCCFS